MNYAFLLRLVTLPIVFLHAVSGSQAAEPSLNALLDVRPLTPQEIKEHALQGTPPSGGLNTTGLGQPFYLDALINIAIPPADITNVVWALVEKPVGSGAAIQGSPLGAGMPVYKVADRGTLQVAGRAMLRPDLSGQYTVRVTITLAGGGSTNVSRTLTAGLYMGAQTCALCHVSGGMASNIYATWTNTAHASAFKNAINGVSTSHFGQNCISCHVVGFDTNAAAANGGFDDVAARTGWTFPSTPSDNNWNSMPAALRAMANVQCENCHGPGSEHVYAFGKTNVSNWPRLGVSLGAGDCAQCHDSAPYHIKTLEWAGSMHAVPSRVASGANRAACVRCHTAGGFVQFTRNDYSAGTNTTYEAITCQACHDSHDARHGAQLRAGTTYSLPDGTVVSDAGLGGICFQCHHSRNGSAEANVAKYKQGLSTWAGGSSFGTHASPQGDMLQGANAITYGLPVPGSAHGRTVTNSCVGCHMQPVATFSLAFGKAGGHTFKMSWESVTNGIATQMDLVGVCVGCHGDIRSFDIPLADYSGDGVIEGIQSEVRHLLDELSTLLPNSSGVVDGQVKSTLSVRTNWSTPHLKGAYNWQFVRNDGSFGIHNPTYAVGLLKASIGDLTGDANSDGLPDAWQIQYFGSANHVNASPSAAPAGDGVPNWLKHNLGLDPLLAGTVLTNGVIWASSGTIDAPGLSVRIYTAAEITFPTETGKIYQVQAISTPGGGWSNIGAPIAGTGDSISLMLPTHNNAQHFFRVVPVLGSGMQ